MRLDDLPPLPPGALGWKVYSGFTEASFVEFVSDDQAVDQAGADMADQVEGFLAGES